MNLNISNNRYLEAKELVKKYEKLLKKAPLKKCNISIDMEVKLDDIDKIYWVSEISGSDILIRTTYSISDILYDDYLVSIWRLKKV